MHYTLIMRTITIIHRNHQITVCPSVDAGGFPEFLAHNYCLALFVSERGATENEALEKAKASLDNEIEKKDKKSLDTCEKV